MSYKATLSSRKGQKLGKPWGQGGQFPYPSPRAYTMDRVGQKAAPPCPLFAFSQVRGHAKGGTRFSALVPPLG